MCREDDDVGINYLSYALAVLDRGMVYCDALSRPDCAADSAYAAFMDFALGSRDVHGQRSRARPFGKRRQLDLEHVHSGSSLEQRGLRTSSPKRKRSHSHDSLEERAPG